MKDRQLMNPGINTTNMRISRDERFWQEMPGGRYRVNPDAVPALQVYLCTVADQWQALLRVTGRGMTRDQRKSLRNSKRYARHCIAAVHVLAASLHYTHVGAAVDRLSDEWVDGFQAAARDGAIQSITPPEHGGEG